MVQSETGTRGWVLGRAFGARIVLHPSTLILIALIAFLLVSGDQGRTTTSELAHGLLLGGILIGSVLIHELGHALAAHLFGREVKEIVLSLVGGHTAFDAWNLTPRVSGLTAFAGPLTSAVLGLSALAVLGLDLSPGPNMVVRAVAVINIILAIFNALPGAPLDGGMVLEAIVWGATGSRTTGMKASAWGGRVIALAYLAYVIVASAQAEGGFDMVPLLWAFLIFSILWPAAGATLKAARVIERIEGMSVARTMTGAVAVPHDMPLGEALELCRAAECEEVVVLSTTSEPAGHFALAAAAAVPKERLGLTDLAAVTVPIPRGAEIDFSSTGRHLLQATSEWWGQADVLVVLDEGEVVGVVRLAEVSERLG